MLLGGRGCGCVHHQAWSWGRPGRQTSTMQHMQMERWMIMIKVVSCSLVKKLQTQNGSLTESCGVVVAAVAATVLEVEEVLWELQQNTMHKRRREASRQLSLGVCVTYQHQALVLPGDLCWPATCRPAARTRRRHLRSCVCGWSCPLLHRRVPSALHPSPPRRCACP